MADKIDIRGVKFDSVSLGMAVDILMDAVGNGGQTAVFTPNSEIVQQCIEHEELYEVINSAELTVPDGVGVIKAGKILGTPFPYGKVAGIEVGEHLIERLSKTDHTVFFLGSKPGIAEQAAEKLGEKYPGIKFAGCHDGYFKKSGEENDAVIATVNESGAEVLFVCLGAPAQEKWIYANRSKLPGVKVLLGLGGSLDGYSGNVKRAPKIFIKLGLEWFYRLLKEPKRIGRMMKLPKFYFGTWLYKIRSKKQK